MNTPTPGPWRWEINLHSRQVNLCGGKPRFDKTVIDFVRWGMSGAQPRFLQPDNTGLMLMSAAADFAVPVAGREHHETWFRDIDHPDARLIAAAPDLLASCKELREALAGAMRVLVVHDGLTEAFIAEMKRIGIEDNIGVRVESAIAKAEGR